MLAVTYCDHNTSVCTYYCKHRGYLCLFSGHRGHTTREKRVDYPVLNIVLAIIYRQVRCGIPREARPVEHKLLTGYLQRQVSAQLSTKTKRPCCGYTQRAEAETGFSMIKLTHVSEQVPPTSLDGRHQNLMISHLGGLFYKAGQTCSVKKPSVGQKQKSPQDRHQ